MNANRNFRLFGILALAMLAMSLAPTFASAQEVKGTFTLPVATRWGQVTLLPGKYSVSIVTQAFPSLAIIEGEGMHVLVMATATETGATTGQSKLVIARFGGRARVQSLYIDTLGVTLQYAPPKREWLLLAQVPELIEQLPINMGG